MSTPPNKTTPTKTHELFVSRSQTPARVPDDPGTDDDDDNDVDERGGRNAESPLSLEALQKYELSVGQGEKKTVLVGQRWSINDILKASE